MGGLLRRLWSFDHLLGVDLVKLIYYVGLIGIVAGAAIGMLFGLVTLTANLGAGVVQLIAIPAVAAVSIVYWRFVCEFFMVIFQMNDRLGDLRNTVMGVPPVDPNAPEF